MDENTKQAILDYILADKLLYDNDISPIETEILSIINDHEETIFSQNDRTYYVDDDKLKSLSIYQKFKYVNKNSYVTPQEIIMLYIRHTTKKFIKVV